MAPPSVLASISVISLLPIAKTNCKISNVRVKHKIVRSFFKKDHLLFNMQIKIPKGTKILTLLYTSEKTDLLNGIILITRTLSIRSKENCNLKRTNQISANT